MANFPFYNDVAAFIVSTILVVCYHAFLARKVKQNPTYTVQAVNAIARAAWVETVMQERRDIMAVQTLRNSTMAATFLASTAVLMIIGIMNLSDGGKLESIWHALNIFGAQSYVLWTVKLLFLLLDMFVAFFSFAMAVRVFNHVGYLVNVPLSLKHKMMTPAHVATHLNRAGRFYSIGMRAYYFSVPLVFWLFGPHFMLLATLGLLLVLYRIDRSPKIEVIDYSDIESE